MPDQFRFDVFVSHSAKDKSVVRISLSASTGERVGVRCRSLCFSDKHGQLCASLNGPQIWRQQTFRFRDPLNKERRFIPLRLDEASRDQLTQR